MPTRIICIAWMRPLAERAVDLARFGLSPFAVGPGSRSYGPHPEGLACGVCEEWRNDGSAQPPQRTVEGVFNVLTNPANESGELEFEAPDDYFSHAMALSLIHISEPTRPY